MKHRYIKFVALLLVCCTFFSCKPEEKYGTIFGTVTDFATGEPVGNANVKLRPNGETTLTGSDGAFEFKDLEAGKYSLLITNAQYADLDDDYIIELKAGEEKKRDVQLQKKVDYNVFGSISGTVIDLDSGDPIPQATVTLSPSGMNTYTGNDGTIDFLDLDARQYTVTVQKTGYQTNRKTVTTVAVGNVNISLPLMKNN